MKSIIIPLVLLLSCPVFAQGNMANEPDTLKREIKEIHSHDKQAKGEFTRTQVLSDPIHRGIYKRSQNARFRGHWSGFNYGFVNFANTNYSKFEGEEFMVLEWENSFAMQFNVLQHSIRLNSKNNIGLVTGLGLEYQRLRFEHQNSITKNEDGMIIPISIDRVKKSSLKNLYLTIPLMFEWQFPARKQQRAYVSAGVMAGLRLHTKTKVVYKNEEGNTRREKETDNFNVNPIKADGIVRVGYHSLALWGSYTLNSMLKKDKGPEVHPYAIGVGINF